MSETEKQINLIRGKIGKYRKIISENMKKIDTGADNDVLKEIIESYEKEIKRYYELIEKIKNDENN
jgi:hypothetical protein